MDSEVFGFQPWKGDWSLEILLSNDFGQSPRPGLREDRGDSDRPQGSTRAIDCQPIRG
jgi:hypothetical protein